MATKIIVNLPEGTRVLTKSFGSVSSIVLEHLVAEGYVWDDDKPITESDRILIDHAAVPARVYVQRDDRIRDTHCTVVDIPPEIQGLPEIRLVRGGG